MLYKLAIKYLIWTFKRNKINNIELVIRANDYAYYKRNKHEEVSVEEVLQMLK